MDHLAENWGLGKFWTNVFGEIFENFKYFVMSCDRMKILLSTEFALAYFYCIPLFCAPLKWYTLYTY